MTMNAEQAYLHVMDLMFGVKRSPHVRRTATMVRPILIGLEQRGARFTATGRQLWFQEGQPNQWFKVRYQHPHLHPRRLGSFEIVQMQNGRTDGPTLKRFTTQREADAFAINPVY